MLEDIINENCITYPEVPDDEKNEDDDMDPLLKVALAAGEGSPAGSSGAAAGAASGESPATAREPSQRQGGGPQATEGPRPRQGEGQGEGPRQGEGQVGGRIGCTRCTERDSI